jgi:hypothetical protein
MKSCWCCWEGLAFGETELVFEGGEGLATGGAVEFSLAVEKDVAYVAGDGGVRAKLVYETGRQFFVRWHVLRIRRGVRKDLNLVAESRDKVYYGFFCCAFAVRRVAAMHEYDRLGWRKHSLFVVV